MPSHWSGTFAERMQNVTSSTIRELLKLTQQPEVISFAGGLPAAELFPKRALEAALGRIMRSNAALALQYGTTEGYLPLREMIARHGLRYGLRAGPENVLITTGSQQALELLGKLLIDQGAPILLERPSYVGALQAFHLYGPRYLTLPLDAKGMQVDGLGEALRAHPRFLYLLPNFHNPAGITLHPDRRRKIVAAARKARVPIVEDDPYGQLRYEGDQMATLYSLDLELAGQDSGSAGNVVYLSSFSKVLAPGLRLGWVVAPKEVIDRLVQLKQAADLHTSTFCQLLAFEVAREGFLDDHIRRLRLAYRERRDTMLSAMERHFPTEVGWTRPQGGLFLWLTLPEGIDSEDLLGRALEKQVAFVPGSAFFTVEGEGRRHCRLNFSSMRPEKIDEGIARLGLVLKDAIARTAISIRPPEPV